ncbi:unnamed protein product [Protopolystoma xenopodis]|uniref:Uncharacterized protein n=1 Tax=Protopolystoma xenopodis TaxID=117903 RepID=A0A448WP17_9PLAT|nr:unnamed protein product [Protopolystoma xenopodis]
MFRYSLLGESACLSFAKTLLHENKTKAQIEKPTGRLRCSRSASRLLASSKRAIRVVIQSVPFSALTDVEAFSNPDPCLPDKKDEWTNL